MSGLTFEAVKVALKQDRNGFVLTLNIHPDEIPEELMRDFVGSRYGVALVRIQDDETPTNYKNRVSKAGLLCRDKDFQAWLYENQYVPKPSEDEAVNFVQAYCDIKSRSELNGNSDAKEKFDQLVGEYERFKFDSDPF